MSQFHHFPPVVSEIKVSDTNIQQDKNGEVDSICLFSVKYVLHQVS